jgi:hypothetical protein
VLAELGFATRADADLPSRQTRLMAPCVVA